MTWSRLNIYYVYKAWFPLNFTFVTAHRDQKRENSRAVQSQIDKKQFSVLSGLNFITKVYSAVPVSESLLNEPKLIGNIAIHGDDNNKKKNKKKKQKKISLFKYQKNK